MNYDDKYENKPCSEIYKYLECRDGGCLLRVIIGSIIGLRCLTSYILAQLSLVDPQKLESQTPL